MLWDWKWEGYGPSKPATKTADSKKYYSIYCYKPAEVAWSLSKELRNNYPSLESRLEVSDVNDSAGVYKIGMVRMYAVAGILTNNRMYGSRRCIL